MNILDKYYPHPVIGVRDDVQGDFHVNIQSESDGKKICFTITYHLENNELRNLISAGEAKYVTHIFCKGTMLREAYSHSNTSVHKIEYEASKLRDLVELDFFICSNKQLNYKSNSFQDSYKDYTFSISTNEILGYAGKGRFFAKKAYENLKSISALMRINSIDNSKYMTADYGQDKIIVGLPFEQYEHYQSIKSDRIFPNIIHSAIVLPVLIDALYMARDESDQFSTYRWCTVLTDYMLQNNSLDILKTAQKILDYPINRSLYTLQNLLTDESRN